MAENQHTLNRPVDQVRTCTKCEDVKSLEDFYRSKASAGGRMRRCKACVRVEVREYQADSADKIRARYVANRDANRAHAAKYGAENPHVGWESKYRKRAKKYGFTPVVESFTREDLIAKYGDQCHRCGGTFEELDHYPTPVLLEGDHSLENCRPSCSKCNRTDGHSVRNQKRAGSRRKWAEEVTRLRGEGLTYRQIGNQYGVTGEAISALLKQDAWLRANHDNNRQIADAYGVTGDAVRKMLKRAGDSK